MAGFATQDLSCQPTGLDMFIKISVHCTYTRYLVYVRRAYDDASNGKANETLGKVQRAGQR